MKKIFLIFSFMLAATGCSSFSKKWDIGYNDLSLYVHKEHPVYDIHYEYGLYKAPLNPLILPDRPVFGGNLHTPMSCSPHSDQLLPDEVYLSWRLKPYGKLVEYRIKIYPLVEKYGISAVRFTTFTAEINEEHLKLYFRHGDLKYNKNNVLIYER